MVEMRVIPHGQNARDPEVITNIQDPESHAKKDLRRLRMSPAGKDCTFKTPDSREARSRERRCHSYGRFDPELRTKVKSGAGDVKSGEMGSGGVKSGTAKSGTADAAMLPMLQKYRTRSRTRGPVASAAPEKLGGKT